ncbi:glycosyltransferase family 2 protein [Tardiphaga sp. 42S5]|uniref:glycosyltransferase family 2 protein n=1 Tax=Tardiphaga sp. 42S5 TaxID=1404799 RepID=UPI002A5B0EED|nr:glycosyltransferase family 2 protein [Tardiphaga sp. 42S5]WPO44280.1 glycosyltransferase family 2 protein [Tardiphaga sp. 42S5]
MLDRTTASSPTSRQSRPISDNASAVAGSISIVIPALNEEVVLEGVVRDIEKQVTAFFRDYEIILINDGSADKTGEIMDRLATELPNIRVLHNPRNIGLGASYKRGVEEARCTYLMMLCGDGGMPAASLPPIFSAVGSADIVAPYVTNLRTIKSPMRYFTSRVYTNLLNILFGQKIKYYNGLPVHRVDLLRQLRINSTGFAFQGEILTKLLRSGCSMTEVGVAGAEMTRNSSALRLKGLINIAKVLALLVWEVRRFDGRQIKREALPRSASEENDMLEGHTATAQA